MLTELEVWLLADRWRNISGLLWAGANAGEFDEAYRKGLADGYAGALELVLEHEIEELR